MAATLGKRAGRRRIKKMARKNIAIGESVLDTVFRDDRPVDSFVGGRIANAAASAASAGVPVEMVSECCNDHIGDIITSFLESHHVGTGSVDRFTDGSTAVSMVFYQENGGGKKMINFYNYPEDRFDVVWPRIDEDDVVLFGSFYSIDTVMRDRFYELVKYARERKAILIYLLGCQHGISCRITKVMPGILENLEIADIVVATEGDLADIFPGETADEAFKNHIEFYCANFLYIDGDSCITVYRRNGAKSFFDMSRGMISANPLGWQAGLVCGLVYALFAGGIMHGSMDDVDDAAMERIIGTAVQFAANAAASGSNCIDSEFAQARAAELQSALMNLNDKSE